MNILEYINKLDKVEVVKTKLADYEQLRSDNIIKMSEALGNSEEMEQGVALETLYSGCMVSLQRVLIKLYEDILDRGV